MWDSNSRGTMPLGRRGSDSHQRLSFIAAPFESLFAKRKRTPTVFESRFLCGIRILAALRRSVVAVLTAVKGCHSLPLRSNPCLPKGKGHRWCLSADSMWDSNSRGTTPLGRRGSDSHQRLSFIAAPFESSFAKRKRTPMVSFSFWPALGDSNPQPSESESDTLSNCAKGRYEIPCGIYLFSESFIRFSAFL